MQVVGELRVVADQPALPETLRKIETGRLPTPAFGTIVSLSDALGITLDDIAAVWRADLSLRVAS